MTENRQLYLHEVLDLVKDAKSRKEKRQILLDNNSISLRDFLKGAFDDSVVWALPKGKPPFEPATEDSCLHGDQLTPLFRKCIRGPGLGDNVRPRDREMFFIRVLQQCHPKDADYYIKMKDKKMNQVIKGLTKKLVSDTFEGIIRE